MTIRPDFEKWDQTAEDIRQISIEAEHPRSRERFQAMYMIGSGQHNSSEWAQITKRQVQTVLKWVHRYNENGPDSLSYQHSGGRSTKLDEAEKKAN